MSDKFKDFIKKFCPEIFWFHLSLFFIILPWAVIFSLYQEISLHLVFSLVIIIIGHFVISSLIVYFHEKADTKIISKDKFGILLIQTAGLLEIFFYTFLLIFHQINIIVGYLIVKSIWNYPIESKDVSGDSITKQTRANSIFRIGILLAFLVSLIATFSISSGYDLTKNKNFQTINKIFTTQSNVFIK